MRVLLTLTVLIALAGCTESGSDDPDDARQTSSTGATTSASPTVSGVDCAEVWKDGQTLPSDYTTCVSDGAEPTHDVTECEDGIPLIVFDDLLFARPGEKVQASDVSPITDGDAYRAAWKACTGN